MECFAKRKDDYFKKLKINAYILNKIKVNKGNPQQMMEILLDPKDEKELSFADMTITFFSDALNLVQGITDGSVKQIPLHENIAIIYFINIINALKLGKNVELIIKENEKNSAKILYSFLVEFIKDPQEAMEYIAKNTGFDLEDSLEVKQLKMYMEEASSITSIYPQSIGDNLPSDEELIIANDFCKEFHTLCEEGKYINIIKTLTNKK